MRLSWNVNSQPVFQQATQFLNFIPWRAVGNGLIQQAQSWMQPVVKWVARQEEEEVPLFIKAQAEEKYLHSQAWRSDFRKQMRQLQQDIVGQYRRGVLISPEHLRAALLAQQASFDSDTVSLIYYTRHLKRLAQRLPRYAHTFDGVAAHFKEQLKAQPEEALQYFYNDVVNQLIDNSREDGTVTAEVRTALQAVLKYYQGLVPTALYEAVQNTIIATSTQEKKDQARYQDVLKQLNALFMQAMKAEEQAIASPATDATSSALETIQESLTAGWQTLKAHPKTMLWSAAATALGLSTYRLSQEYRGENAGQVSISWLDSLPSISPFANIAAAFSLPVAMSYLTASYAQQKVMPLWQTTIPLAASWLSQLSPVAAQTERWAKTLGGASVDIGNSVQQTTDGGYIITGYTSSFGADSADLWLSKWASNGTVSWAKTLGGTGSDTGNSVQQTTDGGYIVTGNTVSFGAGFDDLWLSKWTSNGSLSWAKTLGGLSNDRSSSVQQTTDGGYIVTGYTANFGASGTALWLSKWSSNGSLSWVKTLGGTSNDGGSSVQQTTDGGYIVTGYTRSFGAGNIDLWLSKWTSNGSLSWVKTLGGANDDFGQSVQQTIDGGYIVTGYTRSFGAGYDDLWLLKWTSNGSLSWVKTLGGTGNDYSYSVQQTTDGGYIVTGNTASFGTGSTDLWLSKWTSNGSLSWVKTLGGTSNDGGSSVQQTTDGGYIVTGNTNSFGGGSSDLWLSKWDSQGMIDTSSCVFQPSINSATIVVSAADLTITPGTPTVSAQSVAVSTQTISPTWGVACNEPPILTNSGGGFTYTENDPATVIDSSITVYDFHNVGLSNARVSISAGFVSDQDILSFTNQNGISGNYSSGTGVLALNGMSSVSNYQTALRSVTYQNIADNLNINPRTFSFTVNDGEFDSNAVTRTATIIAVNDAPVLTSSSGGIIYVENDPAIVIDNGITISDVDSTNLSSARVSISTGFRSDQDVLGFIDQNGITGSYNNTIGELTLTGTGAIANYQAALRSVTYENTSDNPSTNSRIFNFTVNDGEFDSNAVTRMATIIAINNAPLLNNQGGGFIYTENDPATNIDSTMTVNDMDDTNLVSASVSISGGFAGEQDVLGFTPQNGITGDYSQGLGVLTLSGTSSVANYQAALRSVTYQNTADNPTTNPRTFSFTVNDGELNSNTVTRTATIIAVNDAPVLVYKQLTINQDGRVTLTSNNLQATDGDAAPADLQFTISDIEHGYFERSTAPETAITTFSQQEIDTGVIRFVHDGSSQAPSYRVSVSDGELTTPPVSATINFIPRSEFTPSFTASPQDNTALIAGLVSGAAALAVGVIGTSYCYIKKRQQQAREKAHAEAGIEMVSTVRQEKGYTVISGESYHYALINKLKAKDAHVLSEQTGIEVDLQGEKKAKLTLGQGKFGRLRLAKVVRVKTKTSDIAEQTYVGVKKIKGEKEIAASQAEAMMQFKLKDKPHIMPLLDSVETVGSEGQKVLYQFMPLAGFGNGETLQAHLATVSDETHRQRLMMHVAKGLLTGLTHMHDSQIYHLDIKPSNVVLTLQGEVLIIDFGCAQQLAHQQLIGGNGDTRYFAPERLAQCRQQQAGKTMIPIDAAKVDAWAMGVALLEMSLNRYPWEHKAAHERLTHWDETYFARQLKQLSVLANPAPGSYWAIVKGLLEPDPARRLTIAQALTALVVQRQYDFSSLAAQQRAFQDLKALPVTPAAHSSTKEDQQQYAHLYLGHKGTGTIEVSTVQASYSSEGNKPPVVSPSTVQNQPSPAFLYVGHKGKAEMSTAQASYSETHSHPSTSGTLQSSPRTAPSATFFQPPKTNTRSVQPVGLSLEEREIRSAHYQPQG